MTTEHCASCGREREEGVAGCADCDGGGHAEQRRAAGSGGRLAERAAPTAVFRPDELGLPGQSPTITQAPPPFRPPTDVPDRSRRLPAVLVTLVLAVAAVGIAGFLLLRDGDQPADTALGALTGTADPRSDDPVSSTPTPLPAALPTSGQTAAPSTTPAPTPRPSGTSTPVPDGSAQPAAPPAGVLPGFLVSASDARSPLPEPVLTPPTPAWQAADQGPVTAVVGDRTSVVVATQGASRDTLTAYDRASGDRRWSIPLEGRVRPDGLTLTDTLLVVIDRADGGVQLVGLVPSTGAERWARPMADPGELSVITLPDGGVVLGDRDRLSRLDLATGSAEVLVEGDVQLGRGLAAGYDGDIVRVVDLQDGTLRYELSVGPLGGTDARWVFTEDRVVVHDGVTVWSVSTIGQREWDFTPTDPNGKVQDLVRIPDDRVLVVTIGTDGTVALDQATGAVVWRSPVTAEVIGQFDGVLRGLGGPHDQRVLLDLVTGATISALPAWTGGGTDVANGVLYGLGTDGITAVSLVDGQPLWTVAGGDVEGLDALDGAVLLRLADGQIALLDPA